MKKQLLALIVGLFSLGATSAPLQVLTTLPVLGDIAKKVGGDLVEVSSLAEPNQDPHTVIAKPSFFKMARKADVFIENGLSLEIWAQKVVDGAGSTKIQVGQPGRVVASAGISTIDVPTVLTRANGDVHPGGNPHVWLDPENAKIIAKNISEGFSRVDPDHKADYAKKLAQFVKDIDTRMVVWKKTAESLKGAKIITYHKSFGYFANRFGFFIAGEIEDMPGMTPGAKHRDELIALMKSEKIGVIVQELYYDRAFADFMAKATAARVVQIPIDVGADPAASDYFSLIDLLLSRLVEKKL